MPKKSNMKKNSNVTKVVKTNDLMNLVAKMGGYACKVLNENLIERESVKTAKEYNEVVMNIGVATGVNTMCVIISDFVKENLLELVDETDDDSADEKRITTEDFVQLLVKFRTEIENIAKEEK